MISHLGKMPSLVVGGTWAARQAGEDVFGLAVIGDGGSSTGEIHESLNLASVHKVPVLFLIENNHYSFSTPTSLQYNCRQLSDRAHGYGIAGRTIDGTDAWEVYTSVCDALESMQASSLPMILECMTSPPARPRRLRQGRLRAGRADAGVAAARPAAGRAAKAAGTVRPVGGARGGDGTGGRRGSALGAWPRRWRSGAPTPRTIAWPSSPKRPPLDVKPYHTPRVKNGEAVGRALGLSVGEQPAGVPLRARRGRLRLGLQDLQGTDRTPRPAAGAGHAAVRIGPGRLCPGGFAGGRAADPGVPVRRFLDRSRHAARPERRHLVLPQRPARPAAVAAALRRRADDGGLSLGRVRGAVVAFPGAETALSGHRPRDVRGPGGRLLRSQSVPGLRAQAALLEQERGDRFRRQPGSGVAAAALHRRDRSDAGGLRGDGPRGAGGGRAQPPLDRSLEPVRASADGPRPDPGIGVQDGAAAGGAGVRGHARAGRPRDLAGSAARRWGR